MKCLIEFEVEHHDIDSLVGKLANFEEMYDCSTIEMFSNYAKGQFFYVHGNDNDMEEWIDTFILFLGTSELERFVNKGGKEGGNYGVKTMG